MKLLSTNPAPRRPPIRVSTQSIGIHGTSRTKRDMAARTLSCKDYTMDVICALDVEQMALDLTLNEEHGRLPSAEGDDKPYTFGKLGRTTWWWHACRPA
jgi:hypothetical protein